MREVGVRFPLGAVIHLASAYTLARVNLCHVRGIGYHYSDTRVWVDETGIVTCRGTHEVRPRVSIALPVSFECHGIRHGLAARVCQVAVSVSAVIPTPSGIGPIPNAFGGLISIISLLCP